MRKIAVLTGTRAEYGLLKPVMKAIQNHPQLELATLVAGMHLSNEFGNTIDEIRADGFTVNGEIEMNPQEDHGYSMAQAIGKGIIECSKKLQSIDPDIFLVLGDRIEPLAGVIAAAYMNIPIAHIHGGDSARAGLDESARHAITKFAHIHFAVTEKSAERVRKLGENPAHIFVVGAPGLDTILNTPRLTKGEMKNKFSIDLNKPLIVVVQHSVSTAPEKAEMQIQETLEALKELKHQTIIIYPNSDSGGRKIIQQIKKYETEPWLWVYKSLPHNEYISLLSHASVLVGNSSSGIIESSSLYLPVVNIGMRQEGRERSTNVLDVPHDRKEIVKAIQKTIQDRKFMQTIQKCNNPYGEGNAGERIAETLHKVKLNKNLLQKRITY